MRPVSENDSQMFISQIIQKFQHHYYVIMAKN